MQCQIYHLADQRIVILPRANFCYLPEDARIFYHNNKWGLHTSYAMVNPLTRFAVEILMKDVDHQPQWKRAIAYPLRSFLRHVDSMQHRAVYILFLYREGVIRNATLWSWLSQEPGLLPADLAADVYESLGFEPHQGYPLLTTNRRREP